MIQQNVKQLFEETVWTAEKVIFEIRRTTQFTDQEIREILTKAMNQTLEQEK